MRLGPGAVPLSETQPEVLVGPFGTGASLQANIPREIRMETFLANEYTSVSLESLFL